MNGVYRMYRGMTAMVLCLSMLLGVGVTLIPGGALAAPNASYPPVYISGVNVAADIAEEKVVEYATQTQVEVASGSETITVATETTATRTEIEYRAPSGYWLIDNISKEPVEVKNGEQYHFRYQRDSGTLTLNSVTIQGVDTIDGVAAGTHRGAAIYAAGNLNIIYSGNNNLTGATINGGSAAGIYVVGQLTLTDSGQGNSDTIKIQSGNAGGDTGVSYAIHAGSIVIEPGGKLPEQNTNKTYAGIITLTAGKSGGQNKSQAVSKMPTLYEYSEWYDTRNQNKINQEYEKVAMQDAEEVVIRPSAVPSEPRIMNEDTDIQPGDNSVTVVWREPEYLGAGVNEYDVTWTDESNVHQNAIFSPGGNTHQEVVEPDGTTDGRKVYTAKLQGGMKNGQKVDFTMWAENNSLKRGDITFSSTPAKTPDAPSGITAQAGDMQMTLEWYLPLDPGEAEIDKYYIICTPTNGPENLPVIERTIYEGGGGYTRDGNKYTAVLGDLVNGYTYEVSITAHNEVGFGPAGILQPPILLPICPPGDVASDSIIPETGNGKVTLSWTAPNYNGGAPIENYRIEYINTKTGVVGEKIAGVSPFTIEGLTNDDTYQFNIYALNNGNDFKPLTGDEVESVSPGTVYATPEATPPEKPGIETAPGNGWITVSWTPPLDNGGEEITSYVLKAYQGRDTSTPIDTFTDTKPFKLSYTVDGLRNGTTYRFEVVAVNIKGSSEAAVATDVPTAHKHCDCGAKKEDCKHGEHADIEFDEFVSNGGYLASGHYYLVKNTVVDNPIIVSQARNVVICLNGFTLKYGNNPGSVINLEGGTLTICDCTNSGEISGGMGTVEEAAPAARARTLAAAANTGTTTKGGAIYAQSGTVTMYGGALSNNRAAQGGGVYLGNGGALNMLGGTITNNNAEQGGGVYVSQGARFYASGAPSVVGNVAAGSDNKGKANNVFLEQGAFITPDQLSDGATLGVTTAVTPEDGESVNITSAGITTYDYLKYFSSDEGLAEQLRGSYIQLVQPQVPGTPESADPAKKEGNRTVTIYWEPPYDDGGSPITNYLVMHNKLNEPVSVGANFEYTATGLTNGTDYTFQVWAENAKGRSAKPLVINAQPSMLVEGESEETVTGTGPKITSHPGDMVVSAGKSATFTVNADAGGGEIRYIWQTNQNDGKGWVTIPNSDDASYTTPAASLADDGDLYRCVVVNANGRTTSYAAMLGVKGGTVTGDNGVNSSPGSSGSANSGNNSGSNNSGNSNSGSSTGTTGSNSSSSTNKNNNISIPKTGGGSELWLAVAMLAAAVAILIRRRGSVR